MYSETDILKSGNDLHKNPEILPLKRGKLFPLFFNFSSKYCIKKGSD